MNKPSGGFSMVVNQAFQYLVFIYQAIVVVAFLAIPFWAVNFFQQPFLGVFIEHTLVTNGVGINDAPEWTLYNQGQGLNLFGNQLTSLSLIDPNNNAASTIHPKSYDDIFSFLAGRSVGENVRLIFLMADGAEKTFDTALSEFPISSQWQYFYIPYLIGLVYLGAGLWIFGMRRNETAGRAFSIFATSVAAVSGALLDLYSTHYLTALWVTAVPLTGAALLHLGLVFPQETRSVSRYPFLRLVGYIVAIFLAIWNYSVIFNFDHPIAYAGVWKYSYIFVIFGILSNEEAETAMLTGKVPKDTLERLKVIEMISKN